MTQANDPIHVTRDQAITTLQRFLQWTEDNFADSTPIKLKCMIEEYTAKMDRSTRSRFNR